jgi:hypothetical protein
MKRIALVLVVLAAALLSFSCGSTSKLKDGV